MRCMMPLNVKRSMVAATVALMCFGSSGSASAADTSHTALGFYLDDSPGRFVEYLSVNESSHDVVGYFEAIHSSSSAADGQSRTQIFATLRGNVLSFGKYIAERTGEGFTLTAMSPEGEVVQRRFVRASVQSVNASIVAFQKSVILSRIRAAVVAKNVDMNRNETVSVDDAGLLRQAEAKVNAARAELDAARSVAERVSAAALKARVEANAAIEQPGASLAENQIRMAAMNLAGNAEQNEAVAEHRVDIAATALGTARAEVARLRSRGTGGVDRTQASASRAGGAP